MKKFYTDPELDIVKLAFCDPILASTEPEDPLSEDWDKDDDD